MAQHSKATFTVTLVLLGCLVGSLVEAQLYQTGWDGKPAQAPVQQPRPQAPQFTKLPPPPPPPQTPKRPQFPLPANPPKLPPQFPQVSKFPQHPQVPKIPQHPQVPKIPQHPQVPNYPQNPQVPNYPQHPQVPEVANVSPPHIPVQSCTVEYNQRVPCGPPGINADVCSAIGCCFEGNQCYYGKAVTVQCTKDGQFIVVVARDATLPNIDLESISLLGQGHGCSYTDSNSAFAIYQFPVTGCGSSVMEEPGVIIYENRMTSSYEVAVGPRGAITRDSHYQLLFQCRYTGIHVESLVVEVNQIDSPPPVAALGPIHIELRLANGKCSVKGCNEADVAYSSYYTEGDYPVTKVLRDPVYAEVHILEKTDPNLVLNLGRCWATTSPIPSSLPQWDIVVDGCPYKDDRYRTLMVPADGTVNFPSHYKRFILWMFTFVDQTSLNPLKQQLYLHCSTAVCTPMAGHSCDQPCYRKKREVATREVATHEAKIVVSSGLLIMTEQ